MKMSDWLLSHYKKRFGEDIVVLQHDSGPTWNDGGGWNTSIINCGDEVLRVHMPTDYRCDDLQITKMKAVMKVVYEPE